MNEATAPTLATYVGRSKPCVRPGVRESLPYGRAALPCGTVVWIVATTAKLATVRVNDPNFGARFTVARADLAG